MRLQGLDLSQKLGLRVARRARRRLLSAHPHGLKLALDNLHLGLELDLQRPGALVGPLRLLAQFGSLGLGAVGREVLLDLESRNFLLEVRNLPLVLLPPLSVDLGHNGVCLLGGCLELGTELCYCAVLGADFGPQCAQLLLCLAQPFLDIVVHLLELVGAAGAAAQVVHLPIRFVLRCPERAQLFLVLSQSRSQLLHKRTVFMVGARQVLPLLDELRNLLVLLSQLLFDAPSRSGQGGLPGRICSLPGKKLKLGLEGVYALHISVDFLLVLQLGVFEDFVGILRWLDFAGVVGGSCGVGNGGRCGW